MLAVPRYTVRRNAFEPERTWSIEPSGLAWKSADASGHIGFGEIASLRLEWAATRADRFRFACHVAASGGGTEAIVSTTYAGPMNFPDQADAYVPFIRELVRRVSQENPGCRFEAGATSFRWLASLAAMTLGLIFLGMVLLSIGLPLTGLIAVKLALLAFLVPLAIAWIRKNRPRHFVPPAIPRNVLPPLTAHSSSQER
ncbi:hypothetical protein [Aestuariivirga sp.]|uniref:hypothetical protein n=1 Tax=Aestuariivirga sp. TaxID=2650926 RepID=UPI0035934A02